MRTVNLSILACSFWAEIGCKFHGRYIFPPGMSHRVFRLNRVWMVQEHGKKNMSTFLEAFIVLHSASRRGDSGLETVISMKKWNFESQESTFCLSHIFFRAPGGLWRYFEIQKFISRTTFENNDHDYGSPTWKSVPTQEYLRSKVVKSMFCWCLEPPQSRMIHVLIYEAEITNETPSKILLRSQLRDQLYRIAHPKFEQKSVVKSQDDEI